MFRFRANLFLNWLKFLRRTFSRTSYTVIEAYHIIEAFHFANFSGVSRFKPHRQIANFLRYINVDKYVEFPAIIDLSSFCNFSEVLLFLTFSFQDIFNFLSLSRHFGAQPISAVGEWVIAPKRPAIGHAKNQTEISGKSEG